MVAVRYMATVTVLALLNAAAIALVISGNELEEGIMLGVFDNHTFSEMFSRVIEQNLSAYRLVQFVYLVLCCYFMST